MEMKSILPIEEIEALLEEPLSILEYGLDEIEDFISLEPGIMHSAVLRIWDRIVTHSNLDVDPMMLAKQVNQNGSRPFDELSEIAGEPSIKDFHFAEAELNESELDYRIAARIAVSHTFPNDLLSS